jgi:hypothetical protein
MFRPEMYFSKIHPLIKKAFLFFVIFNAEIPIMTYSKICSAEAGHLFHDKSGGRG